MKIPQSIRSIFQFTAGTILSLACLALVACGGGNGGTNSNVQTDVATGLTNTLAVANQGIFLALSAPTQLKFAAIQPQTVTCAGGGTAEVTGDVTSTSDGNDFDLDIDYMACNQQSGVLMLVGSSNVNGTAVEFGYTLDGEITSTASGTCTFTYTGFTIAVSGSGQATIDGTLNADCDGGSATCTYNNVDATDQAALEAACS